MSKKVRYVVRNHPGLATHIHLQTEGEAKETEIETRFTLYESLSYCHQGCVHHGITENPEGVKDRYWGMFSNPDPLTFIGPWVEIAA